MNYSSSRIFETYNNIKRGKIRPRMSKQYELLPQKITERVYANWEVELGGSIGVIDAGDALLAIDSQFPGSAKRFREHISKILKKPFGTMALTHIHADHVLGNAVYRDLDIVGHERLYDKMKADQESYWDDETKERIVSRYVEGYNEPTWLFEDLVIVAPNKTFRNRIKVDGIELKHLAGHTDCSSIIYDRDDRVCFAGDIVFKDMYPWGGDPTADPDDWIEAFRYMLSLDIETIIPGHGPPCGLVEIETQLGWFLELRDELKSLIDEDLNAEQLMDLRIDDIYPPPEVWVKRDTLAHFYIHWQGDK